MSKFGSFRKQDGDDDLPEDFKNLADALSDGFLDRVKHVGREPADPISLSALANMTEDDADAYLEAWLQRGLTYTMGMVFEGAFEMTIKIRTRGTAHKIAKNWTHTRDGIITHFPENLRNAVETDFINRFTEAGAINVRIDWDHTRYAPVVHWEYEGSDWEAVFFYDGAFWQSPHLPKFQDAWKHNIESIVTDVMPKIGQDMDEGYVWDQDVD